MLRGWKPIPTNGGKWACVRGSVTPIESVGWRFVVSVSLSESLVVGCWTEAEREVSTITPVCGQSCFLETAATQQVLVLYNFLFNVIMNSWRQNNFSRCRKIDKSTGLGLLHTSKRSEIGIKKLKSYFEGNCRKWSICWWVTVSALQQRLCARTHSSPRPSGSNTSGRCHRPEGGYLQPPVVPGGWPLGQRLHRWPPPHMGERRRRPHKITSANHYAGTAQCC